MSLNWYSISISSQSTNATIFQGKFSVYSSTQSILHFYNVNNLGNNLLEITTDDYSADFKFINNNFTFNGTTIKNIPSLDTIYNSSEWSIWYYAGDANPNLSYKDTTTGNWIDLIPYGNLFSFTITQITDAGQIPAIPNPIYSKYTIILSDGSNTILDAYIMVDITTNVISEFHDNASADPSSNILIDSSGNYSDNKYINSHFSFNGTLVSDIPNLTLTYPLAVEWQLFSYFDTITEVYKTAFAYKKETNEWIYLMPYVTNYNVSINLYNPNNVPCFNHDTKILCLNKDLEEEYIPVQSLRKGHLVKTFLHGYRKIKKIGVNRFINDPSNYRKCMYIMKKGIHANLFEDLIITGDHSILVEHIFRNERIIMRKRLMGEEQINSKKLVMSSISNFFEKITNNNEYTYYHFCVEDEETSHMKFGVWSNGILAEIPSANQFVSLELNELTNSKE